MICIYIYIIIMIYIYIIIMIYIYIYYDVYMNIRMYVYIYMLCTGCRSCPHSCWFNLSEFFDVKGFMNNNQIIRQIKPYVNHILTRYFHGNGGIKRNCFFCRLSAFQEAFCSTRNFVNYILQWRSILLCLDRTKMGSCRAWRKICSASLNSTCEI